MNEDKIPAGKYCISTSNRNFEGRQGPECKNILSKSVNSSSSCDHRSSDGCEGFVELIYTANEQCKN